MVTTTLNLLPPITDGTDKQNAWAADIRREAFRPLVEHLVNLSAHGHTEAYRALSRTLLLNPTDWIGWRALADESEQHGGRGGASAPLYRAVRELLTKGAKWNAITIGVAR